MILVTVNVFLLENLLQHGCFGVAHIRKGVFEGRLLTHTAKFPVDLHVHVNVLHEQTKRLDAALEIAR